MRKWFRKSLPLFIALLMFCSFASIGAFAESKSRKLGTSSDGTVVDSGKCGEKAGWKLYEDGSLHISGTGDMEDYEWDNTIPGVTYPWAEYRGSIVSVIIEDGITGIGDYAFADCNKLTGLTVSDSVTRIGGYAFSDCNELTALTLPAGITHIGEYAFMECESITQASFYAGVVSIGDGAFSECRNLMEVSYYGSEEQWDRTDFGKNVWDEVLGSVYFMENDSEETSSAAYVPTSARIDGGQCGKNVKWELFEDGTLHFVGFGEMEDYKWDNDKLIATQPWNGYYDRIKTAVIDDGITNIGERIFQSCKNLVSVTIPDSVTDIGHFAFDFCTSLPDITIPDHVTGIGDFTFAYCESLSAITIPDSVKKIGIYAFSSCKGLKTVKLPNSVTSIGKNAFELCAGLKNVYYYGSDAEWNEISFGDDVWPDTDGSVYIMDEDGAASPAETVTAKIDGGQCGKDASWELFEDGTLYIRGSGQMETFSWDYNAKKVTQPWVGYSDRIKSAVIEDGITNVGGYAFALCYALENVTIPDSVTFIGSYAFDVCLSLESITLPDSVTVIGDFAFARCASLTDVTIPDSVKTVRGCAFMECSSLRNVSIPDSVKTIVYGAFDGTPWLAGQKDEFVVAGDNVLLKYTGTAPDVKIPNGIKYISNAFTSCSALVSTTSVSGFSFESCTSLINVTIPDSVTEIGEHAFSRCINLESVSIPEGVEKIDYNAFWSCENLKSVAIPASVTEIGNRAFDRCVNLTDIRYASSKEQWEKIEIGKDIWEGVPGTVTYEAETETGEPSAESKIDSSEIKFAEAERTPEENYLYAGEQAEKSNWKAAADIYKKLGSYKDSAYKYKNARYEYGLSLLDMKNYNQAIEVFTEIKGYKDSFSKIKEVKYTYILNHKNSTDPTTYEYLKELKSSGYKDSRNIYNDLYAWKASVVINCRETDTTGPDNIIGKYLSIFCHVELSGGPPEGKTEIKAVGYWPDGTATTVRWGSNNLWEDGYSGYAKFYYEHPENGRTGKFTVKVYAGTELIGQSSTKIVD